MSDNNAEINLGERAEKSFHHGCGEHFQTNPSLSCLTGKTSVYDPMPTCLFELCNYRPASAFSFKPLPERDVCDAVQSEPGRVGSFTAIYSRSQCVQAGLLSVSQFGLRPLVWEGGGGVGGLCHQEGGLLNSSSVWEESVRFFFRDGGRFACSDPLHLFISAARFPPYRLPGFAAVCVLLWLCSIQSSAAIQIASGLMWR